MHGQAEKENNEILVVSRLDESPDMLWKVKRTLENPATFGLFSTPQSMKPDTGWLPAPIFTGFSLHNKGWQRNGWQSFLQHCPRLVSQSEAEAHCTSGRTPHIRAKLPNSRKNEFGDEENQHHQSHKKNRIHCAIPTWIPQKPEVVKLTLNAQTANNKTQLFGLVTCRRYSGNKRALKLAARNLRETLYCA
jgi:hypothetical protein